MYSVITPGSISWERGNVGTWESGNVGTVASRTRIFQLHWGYSGVVNFRSWWVSLR